MRAALRAAVWVLVASAVVGCSGGSVGHDADDSPSAQVFCDALAQFRDDIDAADADDLAAYVAALKEAAARLERIGTPEDIPDSARAGFELTIKRIQDLADDATQESLSDLGDVREEEQATLDDLEAYIERTCPDLADSESPSPS
jgi:hypothetical protein